MHDDGRPSDSSARRSERAEPLDRPLAAAHAGGYRPPQLHVYGTIRTLTSTGGRVGKSDKAVKHSRTGF